MERLKLPNGIHDIENEAYHSSEGISCSMLMHFMKSPYHYHKRFSNPDFVQSEPTPALIMGDLVHTMVLEPHKADDRYIVRPPMDRRTKAGKIEYEKFMCSASGRMVIDSVMLQQAVDMGIAVRDNELAQSVLEGCKIEQSIYFNHEPTGIQLKCRPDAMRNSLVVDLKTTNNASYRDFQSSAFRYGYFIQAAFIYQGLRSLGTKMEKFVFIAVEKEPPYAVGVYILDDEALEYAINQLDLLMQRYAICLDKNIWPGYSVQNLSLPNYAKFEDLIGEDDDE